MRRRARFLAVAALFLTAPAMAPEASARSGALFGFNDSALRRGYSPRAVLPLLERTGTSVYRIDIEWQYAEPRPGLWRWEQFDRLYETLLAAGIRPLAVVRSAPAWAQDASLLACPLSVASDKCQAPPSADHLGDWSEFVRRVAERYAGLAGVEVFNEPNYAINNWRPSADPEHYTAVLQAAHAAVKAVRPRMPVVFGGMLNVGDSEPSGNMSAPRFLREAYAAGARGQMDAIAIHPYSYLFGGPPGDPGSPYRRTLEDVRRVRDQAGDRRVPLWITEFGYHTGTGAPGGVSPEMQARRLVESVRLALAEPDVEVVIVHSLVDLGRDLTDPEAGFGVVRSDLTPKPALGALAALTGAPKIAQLALSPRRLRAGPHSRAVVTIALSEPATIAFTIQRRASRTRRYRVVRRFSRGLGTGSRRLRLPLKPTRRGDRRLRSGAYSLSARATDRTGERSSVRSVRFRVVR